MTRPFVTAAAAIGMYLIAGTVAAADRQIRPYIGTTFAGSSTYVDLSKEDAPGQPHFTFGVNTAVLGEVLGVDVDFAHTPGFFAGGTSNLVLKSSVTTLTGNIVVALPRKLSEYSLRLYFVGGGGIIRVREEDYFKVFDIATTVPAVDVGFGALGFLTNRVGLSWELRRFQRVGGPPPLTGISIAPERLSFWRAHMALVVRY
jgi:hypothetical protein